uniref:Uncharacterized protein n=1 Tax=Geospiza parvula TaxID=87175 RepID=A0A8U8B451_GEOPR
MQWGIKCELRNFTLAVTRLLELGAISRPVDILHSEVWEKCTASLAEDTKSTGSGKSLKAWGKVEIALRQALEEHETWEAARSRLLAVPKLGVASPDYYPHQPFRWVMRHLTDGKMLRDITTPNTPSFILCVADLFPGQPKPDPHSPHATHMYLSYWCPASNPGKSYCNHPEWGYCGHWGCETIVMDARPSGPGWDPQEPDKFLQFTWPNHPGWAVGKVWTAVLQGSKQWVNVQMTRLQPSAPRAVGPNKVIKSTQRGRNMTYPKALPTKVTDVPTGGMETFQIGRSTGSESDPILSMLEATFLSLNESNPNLTDSCWLCYDVKPPFYEGILQVGGDAFVMQPQASVKGDVCTEVVEPDRKNNKWVVPSASGMWVCQRSGVSPCVFLAKFSTSNDFCVQVLIVPRVLYHSDEEVYHLFEEPSRLHKREILTGITIAMLLGLGAAGTATGISALATQHQGLSQLQMTIDEDLLPSLSEVVLQNRRGLDLLLMQQGGLSPALKEECCFYSLRNRLAQRQREREAQQAWLESWFNQSPWLTTLISTLAGPLAMLLLGITFGPCLLNKLVSFVRARLERNNILFVGRQQML